ncbi:MAG: hypothetical protein BVN28_09835 [Nitrospira sp. ST-bin4]|jgi:hypothetical protein|nr:MAG: hypothetical protein BVN28_09835 [Nitrospira sp. ST-bin4]
MPYVLTAHAADAMEKRNIRREWLESVLVAPGRKSPDLVDSSLEHWLRIIPEHDNRVLRVIVNIQANPLRVVTLYFDRTVRGQL